LKELLRGQIFRVLFGITSVIVLVLLYGHLFGGQTAQWEESPDHKKVAECRRYGTSSATTSELRTIELRTRFNPFRHTVLSGLDYGAKLSVSWIDSKNLMVQCGNCGNFEIKCDACSDGLYIFQKKDRWHDVRIHYVN